MKKILIVEDDPAYLKLLRNQLSEGGYQVIEAENGKDGLNVARTHRPDIILLDIIMPGMNGIEVLDQLRKDVYGKSAKVIILTNLEPDDHILEKVLEDEPTYYFIKSDTILAELMERIKDLLLPSADSVAN